MIRTMTRRHFLRGSERPVIEITAKCLMTQKVYCQTCEEACPENAILPSGISNRFTTPTINPQLCTACGACLDSCPASAILMHKNNQFKGTF